MRNVLLTALLCVLLSSPSDAKLASVTFAEFVAASDLILKARAISAFEGPHESGSALLEVREVIFGEYKPKTISLSWSTEEHDQGIRQIGDVYILFLRTPDGLGPYEPAAYGRSYWKVRHLFPGGAEVVDFVYPITMVKMPESLLMETKMRIEVWPDHPMETSITSISVPKLLQELRLRKATPKSRPQ